MHQISDLRWPCWLSGQVHAVEAVLEGRLRQFWLSTAVIFVSPFWILLIYFQFLFCKLLGHFEHLEPEPREWLRAWQGWLAVCAVAACAIIALCYARSTHSLPDRRKGSFGHLWGCRLSCAVVQTATSQRGCEFRIFRIFRVMITV